jgi:hypothetical protein
LLYLPGRIPKIRSLFQEVIQQSGPFFRFRDQPCSFATQKDHVRLQLRLLSTIHLYPPSLLYCNPAAYILQPIRIIYMLRKCGYVQYDQCLDKKNPLLIVDKLLLRLLKTKNFSVRGYKVPKSTTNVLIYRLRVARWTVISW